MSRNIFTDEYLERMKKLNKAGLQYTVSNRGLHIILFHHTFDHIDYWITTDRWHARFEKLYSYGIDEMLKLIKETRNPSMFKPNPKY